MKVTSLCTQCRLLAPAAVWHCEAVGARQELVAVGEACNVNNLCAGIGGVLKGDLVGDDCVLRVHVLSGRAHQPRISEGNGRKCGEADSRSVH
jgi:hypothetical protein